MPLWRRSPRSRRTMPDEQAQDGAAATRRIGQRAVPTGATTAEQQTRHSGCGGASVREKARPHARIPESRHPRLRTATSSRASRMQSSIARRGTRSELVRGRHVGLDHRGARFPANEGGLSRGWALRRIRARVPRQSTPMWASSRLRESLGTGRSDRLGRRAVYSIVPRDRDKVDPTRGRPAGAIRRPLLISKGAA
jgi:hypothetical protein